MKILIPISAVILLLIQCGESPRNIVSKFQLVREDDHLGEYLQNLDSDTLITVRRNTDHPGLVRLNLASEQIDVLDPDAGEAREIKATQSHVAYRLASKVRVLNLAASQIIELPYPALKLTGFLLMEDQWHVSILTSEDQSLYLILNSDGQEIRRQRIQGEVLAQGLTPEGKEYLVTRLKDSLLFTLTGQTPEVVAESKIGAYAAVYFKDSQALIAYFDEGEGTLKLASRQSSGWTIELVDGEPGKTYRGHDIAFFKDGSGFGLLYLDGWALKLRMARRKNGAWQSEALDLQGALGFYTRVLREDPDRLKIAFHAFRTDHPDRRQSFEDLHVIEVKLQ